MQALPLPKIFCPMKSRITFNGINRSVSAATAQPGDCSSIVNLRKKSGQLVPVGIPKIIYTLGDSSRTLLYIHSCSDGDHYISVHGKTVIFEMVIPKGSDTVRQVSLNLFQYEGEITAVHSIGNILIVTCNTTVYYLFYRYNKYIFLGEKPEMPEISFFPKIKYTDAYYVNEYTFLKGYNNPTRLDTEDINYFNTAYYNAFFQLQDRAWERHYFMQPVLMRYAITLYDGSCLFTSAPVMVSISGRPIQPDQMKIRLRSSNDLCTGSYEGQIITSNFSIGFHIHKLNLNNWEPLIKSIDFYIAPEATIFEPDKKQQGLQFNISRVVSNDTPTYYLNGDISFLDKEKIKKEYLQESLFYKIASFEDWKSLRAGESYEIENKVRSDMLVHEEVLSPDNTSLLSVGAEVSYVYNKRLHLANLSKKLFSGFPLSLFNAEPNNTQSVTAYISTLIRSEDKESRVVWSGPVDYFFNGLSPLLSYPDSGAYSMEIAVQCSDGIYKGVFPLTPSKYENRADYLDDSLEMIMLEKTSSNSNLYIPSAMNDTVIQDNVMRVSSYENPFIFPAEQTYSVSNKAIVGITSVTAALSEGQLGEFPLYLFTEEGIWTMQNGSGAACYSLQSQLSREPISKEYPIIPLEEAVILVSPKGLSILQGTSVQQIMSFDELPYEDNSLVKNHNLEYAMLQPTYDFTSLSEYIKKSVMAYNPLEKELIICLPALEYTLVFHLPTLYLYRTTQIYKSFLSDTSRLLGQDYQGRIFDIKNELSQTIMPMSILTRPFSFQSETYQRCREISLRAEKEAYELIFSLWGGNDAEDKFRLIGKISHSGKIPGKLTMRVTGPAYKYFRILITGKASPNFHLWATDMLFDLIDHPYHLR